MKDLHDDLFFSIIIPVYNRPEEIEELLKSLCQQQYMHFEIIIVDDGSTKDCQQIVESFGQRLNIRYFYKENSGQGYSRNFGFKKARGDYFVIFDSDCLIPPHYFQTVNQSLHAHWIDAYGGPDRAIDSFTILQKAINYSMTSPFTTGGIRGNKKHTGEFHPRSFNMGISRTVFEETGGFKITRMGEDIEFSIRILSSGFESALIPKAFVYHKRRTNLVAFFKQLHFFGRARINIGQFYPSEIKWIHSLPSVFVFFFLLWISLLFWQFDTFVFLGIIGLVMLLMLGIHATLKTRSVAVGVLSMLTSFIQIFAYGVGFLSEDLRQKRNGI